MFDPDYAETFAWFVVLLLLGVAIIFSRDLDK